VALVIPPYGVYVFSDVREAREHTLPGLRCLSSVKLIYYSRLPRLRTSHAMQQTEALSLDFKSHIVK